MAAKKRIEVGNRVRIAFDNPPDEWGTVEAIYPATRTHLRRALIRQADGKAIYRPVRVLSILEDDQPTCTHPKKPDIWTLNLLRRYQCPDCGKVLKDRDGSA